MKAILARWDGVLAGWDGVEPPWEADRMRLFGSTQAGDPDYCKVTVAEAVLVKSAWELIVMVTMLPELGGVVGAI